ncbi:L-rhamnose-binding lectin CSL3-like isoform X2 [Toxotes jaculatrix]|uniref:L-rhamnose-binding lectin CSL3-like isoform X2 n=1 Tax=Toxotes jaculatrix TaxID=941984 RepID=UPI001B3AA1FA|nr:L-rhamnose-binding lectin CSL3-like isoform X2 [Toxotes jaculatrix]
MDVLQRLRTVSLLTVFCCSSMTRPEMTLSCDREDFAQRLQCYGGVIIVHNVSASHRQSEACVDGIPPNHLQTPLCSTTPLLNIVRKRCTGQYRCVVPLELCHSVSPCMSRCVWMGTTYTCEPGRSEVIRVLMANYGRTSKRVCGYSAPRSQPPSTSCRYPNTLQVMASRCDGKHRCSVRASNLIFSNPCPGTRKYLQYSFTCVDPGT